eukprot:3627787-Pleurochrysis_carterae.AAC.1
MSFPTGRAFTVATEALAHTPPAPSRSFCFIHRRHRSSRAHAAGAVEHSLFSLVSPRSRGTRGRPRRPQTLLAF